MKYEVEGWKFGQEGGYDTPEEARIDYRDWSGGTSPEEDGLEVVEVEGL